MTRPPGEIVVFQYGIHDASYPRNRRMRNSLRALDGVTVRCATRSRAPRRVTRIFHDLARLWRGSRRADVLLLSEMRLTHAPLVRLVAWFRRATVVVDGFIGLYETAVDDWAAVRPGSLRARRFAFLDWLAVRSAHLFLIDTEVRAVEIRRRHGDRCDVLALPVGAPGWAVWSLPRSPEGPLRILYYGNYIPLHGTELVVEALALLTCRRDFVATFVGDGVRRASIEDEVRRLGLTERCTFSAAVPESDLADLISAADVVLGVFGSSTKARTVVANKVWQGIACGRVVVTQESPALGDLISLSSGSIQTTRPGSASSLCDTLAGIEPNTSVTADRNLHRVLESQVTSAYDELGRRVRLLAGRR